MSRRAPNAKKGHLHAGELADASVTAALVFGLLGFGRLLSAGAFFSIVAAVVLAVLMARRRLRALVFATATAALLAVLLGGIGPITNAIIAGAFGFCGGVALRREWGYWRTLGLNMLVAWPIRNGINVGFLALVTESRKLTFKTIENQWRGVGNFFRGVTWLIRWIGDIPGKLGLFDAGLDWVQVGGFFDGGGRVIDFILRWWYLFLPLFDIPFMLFAAWAVRRLGRRTLVGANRAMAIYDPPPLTDRSVPANPVPLRLTNTRLQRDGGPLLAQSINAALEPGTHHAVVGRNGAGKSTLLDVLGGLLPADGVEQPGARGLGLPGGTTMIGQRPEGQVLAPRVEDDLRWGVGEIDTDAALELVGLKGMGSRLTAELSGGELQRLALAGALMRQPALLLADEATAMLDPAGRAMVVELLNGARQRGAAVVSTSHLIEDRDAVDGFIRLGEVERPAEPQLLPVMIGAEVLRVRNLGHTYDKGAPWAHEALRNIDLTVRSGQLILITGTNGSGKSTLARILAGLLRQSEGEVELLNGAKVAIAFQHARLQLIKPIVHQELASLAGQDKDLTEAIAAFELEPLLNQRIDELSGGQQRRVLLAGLAARDPKVLVLDEPLAGLDSEARAQLTTTIDRIRQRGTAVLVVSHDSSWGHDRLDGQLVLESGNLVRTIT